MDFRVFPAFPSVPFSVKYILRDDLLFEKHRAFDFRELFYGDGKPDEKVIGFWGIMITILAVSTAVFFFLGETGDDIRWLGWLSLLAVGATLTKLIGLRVDWRLGTQFPVLISGITVGLVMVLMQLIIGLGTTLANNVFVHATVRDSILLALMAGVAEELFFRGFIQGSLEGFFEVQFPGMFMMPFLFAVVPASAAFALFHYPAYGDNPQAFFILFMGGILLGSMYAVTQDIGVPIIAHTFNNALATLSGSLEIASQFWYIFVIPAAVAIAVALYLLIKKELST
jgi:membrane protease YdiL (CAAX protease family)